MSHMLDCQLFGLNAGYHHMMNVSLHAANAILLFLLLRSMTAAFWRSAFVAALIALHPLRVESVAWISERKDVLSGLFFMLTLYTYAGYVKTARQSGPNDFIRSRRYWLSAGCFILGLLSKPMLVTVPVVLLVLDFWPLKRLEFRPGSPVELFRRWKPLLVEKLPWFGLSLLAGVITMFAQDAGGAVRSSVAGSRLVNMLISDPKYLSMIFWPHDLNLIYLRKDHVPAWEPWTALLLLGAVTTFCLRYVRQRPYLIAG